MLNGRYESTPYDTQGGTQEKIWLWPLVTLSITDSILIDKEDFL